MRWRGKTFLSVLKLDRVNAGRTANAQNARAKNTRKVSRITSTGKKSACADSAELNKFRFVSTR